MPAFHRQTDDRRQWPNVALQRSARNYSSSVTRDFVYLADRETARGILNNWTVDRRETL